MKTFLISVFDTRRLNYYDKTVVIIGPLLLYISYVIYTNDGPTPRVAPCSVAICTQNMHSAPAAPRFGRQTTLAAFSKVGRGAPFTTSSPRFFNCSQVAATHATLGERGETSNAPRVYKQLHYTLHTPCTPYIHSPIQCRM